MTDTAPPAPATGTTGPGPTEATTERDDATPAADLAEQGDAEQGDTEQCDTEEGDTDPGDGTVGPDDAPRDDDPDGTAPGPDHVDAPDALRTAERGREAAAAAADVSDEVPTPRETPEPPGER